MSAPPGPGYSPAYPPQQPYPPRQGGGSGPTVVAAVLGVLFIVATVIAAVVAHGSSSSNQAAGGSSSAPVIPSFSTGADGPGVDGSSDVGSPTPIAPAPSITVPSSTAFSTPPSLDPEAVNRVFQVYMNSLLYHDLQGLKSATCPKLRHTETGTALNHHYIRRWQGKPYTLSPGLSYVLLTAVVTQADNGVQRTYQWQVVKYPDGRYWVCGFYG